MERKPDEVYQAAAEAPRGPFEAPSATGGAGADSVAAAGKALAELRNEQAPRILTPMGWLHTYVRKRWRGRLFVAVEDVLPPPADEEEGTSSEAEAAPAAAAVVGAAEAQPADDGANSNTTPNAAPAPESHAFRFHGPQADEEGEPRWVQRVSAAGTGASWFACMLCVLCGWLQASKAAGQPAAACICVCKPCYTAVITLTFTLTPKPAGSAPQFQRWSAAQCCPMAVSAGCSAIRHSQHWGGGGVKLSRLQPRLCVTGLWPLACGTPAPWRHLYPQTSDW